jgi:hypothetical protein
LPERDEQPKEKDLTRPENQSADGNKNIPMLHRLQKLILHRVIDAPHVTGNAEKMHRKKSTVKENIG